jgi:cyclopropane fatty-acyl-phospholipid synthase-like methyltransferase
MIQDRRLYAPAVARNREPICKAVRPYLPDSGCVLEIASGSGEHIISFARDSKAQFHPSDMDVDARASIDQWVAACGLQNVQPALSLDASCDQWPLTCADLIVCINMVHISPWAATVGLIRGAARILRPNGHLFLYGPYRRGNTHTAASNFAFDQDLRARNPAWGIRDLEEVEALAEAHGLRLVTVQNMPANNFVVVFGRTK